MSSDTNGRESDASREAARSQLYGLMEQAGNPDELDAARRHRLDTLRQALGARLRGAVTAGRALSQGQWRAAAEALTAFRQDAAAVGVEEAVGRLKVAESRPAALESLTRAVLDMRPLEEFTVQPDSSKQRDWVIPGWLPAGRVTRLSSHGGSGKTYLALELAAAIAAASDPRDGSDPDETWRVHEDVGIPVLARTANARGYREDALHSGERRHSLFRLALTADPAHVLFLTWEDEPEEFNRRLHALPSRRGEEVHGRLRALNLEGYGALWAARPGKHRDTEGDVTGVGRKVEAVVREHRPRLVVIDPVAAAYGCNENDRAAVRRWLSHLNSLARETGAAILLISHPPKHSGSDYSGSTDWDNGVRAAWTLDPKPSSQWSYWPDDDKGLKAGAGLALTLTKANYACKGQSIWLRWTQVEGCRGLEECGEEEAVRAWHEDRGLPAPTESLDPGSTRKRGRATDRSAGGAA